MKATTSLKTFIKERFLATGKCEIEIKASDFISFTTSYGLQKGSLYTSSISKGYIESNFYQFFALIVYMSSTGVIYLQSQ